jgi:drug/metabolite transporter (DMT)-like permease
MDFINNHTGEFAALLTALFWTVTSLSFESASHRIGSLSVNILRLMIGIIFLSVFNFVNRGIASTIMALVPVFIILPAVVIYKQKVTWTEVIGAFVSVAGVALFFI